MRIRALQSFPHKIGADRICDTAWHQAAGVAEAGGDVTVFSGVVHRPLPAQVRVRTTLARGRWRIPYRVLGELRALALHDRLVARALPDLASQVDVVHTWPLAALETLRVARRLGIPTVLERPNAHTAFAYEVVARECARLGVVLPPDHEHAYNAVKLAKEEREYELADFLLCPSEFVVRTFRDRGFAEEKLIRHTYGYDTARFSPSSGDVRKDESINAVFVGVCAVRKGLHLALEAWLRSPASQTGKLRIAGAFVPDYEAKLAPLLAHPSVEALGHCDDVPDLMRRSDVLLLPSLEEGFGLVCVEAMASGCVPLVSDACTEECVHGRNALVHTAGDVDTLSAHITMIHEQPARLAELRASCLADAPSHTWSRAGVRLLAAYEQAVVGAEPQSGDAGVAASGAAPA